MRWLTNNARMAGLPNRNMRSTYYYDGKVAGEFLAAIHVEETGLVALSAMNNCHDVFPAPFRNRLNATGTAI